MQIFLSIYDSVFLESISLFIKGFNSASFLSVVFRKGSEMAKVFYQSNHINSCIFTISQITLTPGFSLIWYDVWRGVLSWLAWGTEDINFVMMA